MHSICRFYFLLSGRSDFCPCFHSWESISLLLVPSTSFWIICRFNPVSLFFYRHGFFSHIDSFRKLPRFLIIALWFSGLLFRCFPSSYQQGNFSILGGWTAHFFKHFLEISDLSYQVRFSNWQDLLAFFSCTCFQGKLFPWSWERMFWFARDEGSISSLKTYPFIFLSSLNHSFGCTNWCFGFFAQFLQLLYFIFQVEWARLDWIFLFISFVLNFSSSQTSSEESQEMISPLNFPTNCSEFSSLHSLTFNFLFFKFCSCSKPRPSNLAVWDGREVQNLPRVWYGHRLPLLRFLSPQHWSFLLFGFLYRVL